MKVQVVPLPEDNLKPVMMKINGRKLVYYYSEKTGNLYSIHIRLKEVNPNKAVKMHHLHEERITIGRLDL